jgi:uncharacterized tellurite resistance protein B-like protein
MQFLKKLFGLPFDEASDPNHSFDLGRVEAVLAPMAAGDAKFLAGVALLLARVARVDFNATDGEKRRMIEMLVKHSRLTPEQADAVVAIALDRAAHHSVEEHIVLRQMNEITDRARKKDIIRALLYVASDDDISEQESEEVFVIAKAFHFSRQEYLELRSEFREYLSVLKGLPSAR